MSGHKHTPGPWVLWTGCSWRRFGSETTDTTVCEPTVAYDGHPDLLFRNGGSDGPDARLIAAAPDLLAALKACEHTPGCDWWAGTGECDCPVPAAIAKAEGR